MGPTHIVWGVSTWLAAAAPVVVVSPTAAFPILVAAALFVPATSAGPGSPDVDRLWAPGREGLHRWDRHRGFTHRVWFASGLTVLAGAAVVAAPTYWMFPVAAAWGWWSHLSGDMIYGRLKVRGRLRGLGLRVGDLKAAERVKSRAPWLLALLATEARFRAAAPVIPVAAWVGVLLVVT